MHDPEQVPEVASTSAPGAGRAARRADPDRPVGQVGARAGVLTVLGLFVAGALLSLVVHALVVPYTSGNADEVVYRFQAEVYQEGWATIPDDGPVFRPWMSGVVDGERLMVFPAGWPAVLAVGGALTGSTTATVAVVIGALGPALWWALLELTRDRRTALVGALATLACPFVVVHSGTLLSYLPALALEAVVLAAVLRARRTGATTPLLAGGLALGALFAVRPLDAGLVGVPLGALLVWSWRGDLRRLARGVGVAAVGAAAPVLATFAYNARVTGSALTFPIEAAGGNNAFGTGPRNIAEGTPVVVVSAGGLLEATAKNLLELPQWMPGGWWGLPLVVLGLVVLWRRDRPATVAVLAVAVLQPVAYAAYWGTQLVSVGRHNFGPFYYAASWLALAAGVAAGVVWLWDRLVAWRPRAAPLLGVASVVVVLATTALLLRSPLGTFETYTDRAETQLDAVEGLPDDSLLVLPMAYDGPWILFPWNQYANDPTLDDPLLYAADAGGPAVLAALGEQPDRQAFQLLAPEGPGNAGALDTEPLERWSAAGATLRVEVLDLQPAATEAFVAVGGVGARCPVAPTPGEPLVVEWRSDGRTIEAVSGCAGPAVPAPGVPPSDRGCVVGVQGGSGPGRVVREERFWCSVGGPGAAPLSVVVPGEPRVGSELDARRPRWFALTRDEADAHLRATITPVA